MAVANVVGSNIFNLLISGAAGVVHPLQVDPRMLSVDMWVMIGLMVRSSCRVPEGLLTRGGGACLLAAYVGGHCLPGTRSRTALPLRRPDRWRLTLVRLVSPAESRSEAVELTSDLDGPDAWREFSVHHVHEKETVTAGCECVA
jgi:hypothetical protein